MSTRPNGPQDSEPPDLALLLDVAQQAVRDVLDEVEARLSHDLVLRLFALRSVIKRYKEANDL
jgi:hypothetical protein